MDWVAAICILTQTYLVGQEKKVGWIFGIIGGLVYLVVALQNKLYGIVFLETIFVSLSVYNFIKWSR